MTDVNKASVLIVDYGSQLTQVIARRVREMAVYSQIIPYDYDLKKLELSRYSGIIFSGGPHCAVGVQAPVLPQELLALGLPVLAICYGAQRLAVQQGGQVSAADVREFGQAHINIVDRADALLTGVSSQSLVWMSHADRITQLPPHFIATAHTSDGVLAAMCHESEPWYAVQFHPEADHSEQGRLMLHNFVMDICQSTPSWTMENYAEAEMKRIREQVGDKHVLLALSGGVDSLVSAVLLSRAIGNQLHCVLVDHGLLRSGEVAEVMEFVQKNFKLQFICIDAHKEFFGALAGVIDPEAKRKIVGHQFIEAFTQARATQLTHPVAFLAQGTIYPDVIESAADDSSKSQVIKSHHNVGGLPAKMDLKLIEPLRQLFKDEVRALGKTLGIPHALIYRHPFPGPGLSIRILGEVTPAGVALLQKADAIFIGELREAELYQEVAQAFCVLAPIKSVGVMGDNRTYEQTIILRAVTSDDFMTGRFATLDFAFLGRVAARIVNEVSGVNRVVYDITNKPPATIEWE